MIDFIRLRTTDTLGDNNNGYRTSSRGSSRTSVPSRLMGTHNTPSLTGDALFIHRHTAPDILRCLDSLKCGIFYKFR